ncbi:hypothetical protein PLICRDRAFT_558955 [Plicaturopsis crispa FD-325 SS-3]|nr:hypothetical protein PLICRDRAFT_558955 [Plicaturopsis crispa FD-325 SS-3]
MSLVTRGTLLVALVFLWGTSTTLALRYRFYDNGSCDHDSPANATYPPNDSDPIQGVIGGCNSAPVGTDWNQVEVDWVSQYSTSCDGVNTGDIVLIYCNVNCAGQSAELPIGDNCYAPIDGCAFGSFRISCDADTTSGSSTSQSTSSKTTSSSSSTPPPSSSTTPTSTSVTSATTTQQTSPVVTTTVTSAASTSTSSSQSSVSSTSSLIASSTTDSVAVQSSQIAATTGTNVPSAAASIPAQTSAAHKAISTGAIAGAAVGGAVGLAALVALVFFMMRCRSSPEGTVAESDPFVMPSPTNIPPYKNYTDAPPFTDAPSSSNALSYTDLRPSRAGPSSSSNALSFTDAQPSNHAPFYPAPPVPGAMSGTRLPYMSEPNASFVMNAPSHNDSSRVIYHIDAEELPPPPPPESVLELPPQYSDRRR